MNISCQISVLDIAAVFLVCLVLFLLILKLRSRWISFRMSYQKRSSLKAESLASRLLQKKGFIIVERQPVKKYTIHENDKRLSVKIFADFIVTKDGYSFVAEVKNGMYNNDITNIQTRRQMLEYYMAYNVDGLLLVDMIHESIKLIQFSFEGIHEDR